MAQASFEPGTSRDPESAVAPHWLGNLLCVHLRVSDLKRVREYSSVDDGSKVICLLCWLTLPLVIFTENILQGSLEKAWLREVSHHWSEMERWKDRLTYAPHDRIFCANPICDVN